MPSLTPNPISDSIWLSGGSFAVGAGNQIFVHSRFLSPSDQPPSARKTPAQDVFEQVALRNGPLIDYHPQLLVQCMFWSTSSQYHLSELDD